MPLLQPAFMDLQGRVGILGTRKMQPGDVLEPLGHRGGYRWRHKGTEKSWCAGHASFWAQAEDKAISYLPFLDPYETDVQENVYSVSVDGYMNMQLANTEEYIDGALSGHLGEVLIRCNNVLYIRGVEEEEEDGEMRE
ncbi:PREDICTED: small nuclear ribonucleoprotein F [Pygoscelis adeliae]|uniref:small nuclear ribonucleoprotein F n=1 Tax=Pygoscelis adeliae TaxID=9238 RepID=UPI0004F50139|nr:PREDICTED: small nuclear ribonucleoprotein F [Pygoscelis adeliae]